MLTRVTITGADDKVRADALMDLSDRFPFVEWGILFSESREGMPRYPTKNWRLGLEYAWIVRLDSQASFDMALSAHLCGKFARDAMAGFAPRDTSAYARVQINGFKVDPGPCLGIDKFRRAVPCAEVICQVRAEADIAEAAEVAARIHGSLLFDPSGGRGRTVERWPSPPAGVCMGYAGGIGPDNVIEVLDAIGDVEAPFWVDMESGVRDEHDQFDIGKVERVLEACAPRVRSA